MPDDTRLDVYLICNAKYHDTNFARLELLKLLAEHEDVVVRVAEDYRDVEAIAQSRLLITYTCDVCPTVQQQDALKQFLNRGGRWFGLHGTSAMLEFVGEPLETDGIVIPGKVDTPRRAPDLSEMLGNHFVSHPPIQPIRVTVADPDHPLVRGIDPFEVQDEPYYCEFYGEIHTLLESRYTAKSVGYVRERPGQRRAAAATLSASLRAGPSAVSDARPLPREIRHAAAYARVHHRALLVGLTGVLRATAARHPLGYRPARGLSWPVRTVSRHKRCHSA